MHHLHFPTLPEVLLNPAQTIDVRQRVSGLTEQRVVELELHHGRLHDPIKVTCRPIRNRDCSQCGLLR